MARANRRTDEGSGHGNSVLTEMRCFDIELPWLENLGFIFQGLSIMLSREAIESRASFWMKETFSGSLPIFRTARRDFVSVFMPTHC